LPAPERKLTRIDPVAAAGFGSAAEAYERARPSYPVDAIEWLFSRTGLGAGQTVVDVAAGTGKLTRLLPASGAHVVAVEPVAEMRALIVGVEAVDGIAEDLPFADGSVDVVTVAQAFHWFDHARALPELHRVLRPGGWLALFWNVRDLESPLQRGVEDLLRPFRGDVVPQRQGTWRAPLAESELFGPDESKFFRYEQQFTVQDLRDRVASTSFVAVLPSDERAALLKDVAVLAAELDEPFPFPYETEVQLFPRR
jgi:SAM-dependent methyltransferase